MGVVFQDFRLLDHLTTYENVALPLRVQGRAETSYRAEVVELLRWVGLGERMHVLPPLLSGGEKQRAAIARALIARPDLLLADEPTGNVDPGLGRRLLRLFVELNRLGTSVIIATHDFGIMDAVDARRLVLGDGRLSDRGMSSHGHLARADAAPGRNPGPGDAGEPAPQRAPGADRHGGRALAGGGHRHPDLPGRALRRRGRDRRCQRRPVAGRRGPGGHDPGPARSRPRHRCRRRPRRRPSPRPTPGIAETRVFSKAEAERLLEPWLGSGLDLSDLPVPRLIALRLAQHAIRRPEGAPRRGSRRRCPGSPASTTTPCGSSGSRRPPTRSWASASARGARTGRDRPRRDLRDARRHGGQPGGRGGAALRRRRRRLHRPGLPAPLLRPRPARRRDRGRRGDSRLRACRAAGAGRPVWTGGSGSRSAVRRLPCRAGAATPASS